MKTINFKRDEIKELIKKLSIMALGDCLLYLNLGMAEPKKDGCVICKAEVTDPHGASQIMIQFEGSAAAGTAIKAICPAKEFTVLADTLLSMGKDISIEESAKGKIRLLAADGSAALNLAALDEDKAELPPEISFMAEEAVASLMLDRKLMLHFVNDVMKFASGDMNLAEKGLTNASLKLYRNGTAVCSATDGVMIAIARSGCKVTPGKAWGEKADYVDIPIPNQYLASLRSALLASNLEKVAFNIDSQNIHLLFAGYSIYSFRAGGVSANIEDVYRKFIQQDFGYRALVDCGQMENAVKILARKIEIDGNKERMGIKVSFTKKDCVLSAGEDCYVKTPLISEEGEAGEAMYMAPARLLAGLSSLEKSNMIIESRGCNAPVILANGDLEKGLSPGCQIAVAPLDPRAMEAGAEAGEEGEDND